MIGSVGYVATRTIHQLIDRNINTVGPGVGTTTANLPLAKLYGRTIAMNMWDGIGMSNYHSLQTPLNKSFSTGPDGEGATTPSASRSAWPTKTAGSGCRSTTGSRCSTTNYAPSGYDRTHMFSAGWNYELPVGKGKKLAIANKVADALVGGWKLSGIFVAYSGTPFTVTGSGSSLQATGNSQTADLIGPVQSSAARVRATRTMRRSASSIR